MCEAYWAVAFHKDASGKPWYRVARLVDVDEKIWELYWHPNQKLRSFSSEKDLRAAALRMELELASGVFTDSALRGHGPEMVRQS